MGSAGYDRFLALLKDHYSLRYVLALLDWDQETGMPLRAAGERANQIALVSGMAHDLLVGDAFAAALASAEAAGANDDPVVETNLREARRDHDRARKLPQELIKTIAHVSTIAKSAWTEARRDNDFPRFAPHLERLLELKREVAERIGYEDDPYDALMDEFEPEMRAATVASVFESLRPQLVELVEATRSAPRQPDLGVLRRNCPVDDQARFCRKLVSAMHFDLTAGRIDVSTHPFCTSLSPLDVRLTTRYDAEYLPQSLFGMLHEAGHGLYEQGLDPAHASTPMAHYTSMGIHESQSRMWENMVGRSRAYWEHMYPDLQATFSSMAGVSLDDWHFAINAVRPSLIRVEADEVTYGLHIMLRFDLERRLLSKQLEVRDVPEAWNTGMQQMMGLTPPDDARGCLQDIHWSMGAFGYFPTYQLGNLYAAQFFDAARRDLGDMDAQFRKGSFEPLREWLRENVHRHGQRFRPAELLQRVAGQELSAEPYMAYLRGKFQPLYGY